jgi:hypothetical protein
MIELQEVQGNTESQEVQKAIDERQIENARVGYQVATSLWSSRAEVLWSQFNAIMTANSVVLAAAILAASNPQSTVLSIGMPVVGLVLCVLWLVLHARGVGYTLYWALSARELEEQFLNNPVRILSRGGLFADGQAVKLVIDGEHKRLRMNFIGRIFRIRWVAYSVLAVFALMYLAILVWGLN